MQKRGGGGGLGVLTVTARDEGGRNAAMISISGFVFCVLIWRAALQRRGHVRTSFSFLLCSIGVDEWMDGWVMDVWD